MKTRRPYIPIAICLLLLMVPFQNCQNIGGDGKLVEESRLASVKGCGEDGFAFLLEEYFIPHCGACHNNGGISSPYFADENFANSFFWAKATSGSTLLSSSLDNRFCGPDCNIEQDSQMHRILQEWIDSPNECP